MLRAQWVRCISSRSTFYQVTQRFLVHKVLCNAAQLSASTAFSIQVLTKCFCHQQVHLPVWRQVLCSERPHLQS